MKKNVRIIKSSSFKPLALLTICAVGSSMSYASSSMNGVSFTDIVPDSKTNINYNRVQSSNHSIYEEKRKQAVISPQDSLFFPANSRGVPGVAIFDYDNDGDLDIYVTNGPGVSNSLYSNQYKNTGLVTFIDVGEQAGVGSSDQDSTGVCYGDIDNDGDDDLLVLGVGLNHLYENQDDGTFKNITAASKIGGLNKNPGSCSMGDINGDGLLDMAIANSWNSWVNRIPLMTFQANHLIETNQLLLNKGNNVFADVSEDSGILSHQPHVTWALALVDYDLDGDSDLVLAEDHGPRLAAKYGGADMGYIRIYNNDSNGKFTDYTQRLGLEQFGGWMSLSFGDVNHDGYMDFFASNVGDYSTFATAPMLGYPKVKGEWGSNWFHGDAHGGITRSDSGDIGATVFGWGSAITDYDNDGDSDIIYHGGLDLVFFQDGSNPGAVLNNDGMGNFNRDSFALSSTTDHRRRNVRGMAVGDLNKDGFVDIVSVSNQNWPEYAPLVPYPDVPIGGQFDDAMMWPTYSPVNPTDISQGFRWNGIEEEDGTLAVELNNGENNNNSVTVSVQGSVGLLKHGRVNRNGLGSVVTFTPDGGKPAMRPFVSGGTYASQHSDEWVFGLNKSESGTLSVMWPGGVKNKLYNVKDGENIILPEIPCSYADQKMSSSDYFKCVKKSLAKLKKEKVINKKLKKRLMHSAFRAYRETRYNHHDK